MTRWNTDGGSNKGPGDVGDEPGREGASGVREKGRDRSQGIPIEQKGNKLSICNRIHFKKINIFRPREPSTLRAVKNIKVIRLNPYFEI